MERGDVDDVNKTIQELVEKVKKVRGTTEENYTPLSESEIIVMLYSIGLMRKHKRNVFYLEELKRELARDSIYRIYSNTWIIKTICESLERKGEIQQLSEILFLPDDLFMISRIEDIYRKVLGKSTDYKATIYFPVRINPQEDESVIKYLERPDIRVAIEEPCRELETIGKPLIKSKVDEEMLKVDKEICWAMMMRILYLER